MKMLCNVNHIAFQRKLFFFLWACEEFAWYYWVLTADFPPPGIRYLPVGCWQLHGVPCKDIGPHHCNEHGHNSCKSKLPSWCSTITTSMHHIYSILQFHHTTPVCNFCAVHCDCVMCAIHSDRGGDSTFMYYPTPPAAFRTNPFSFGIWYNANVANTFIVPYVLCTSFAFQRMHWIIAFF